MHRFSMIFNEQSSNEESSTTDNEDTESQAAEIRRLRKLNQELEISLQHEKEESAFWQDSSDEHITMLTRQNKEFREESERHNKKNRECQEQLKEATMKLAEYQNYPNDLMDQCSKLKMEPEKAAPSEDEVFQKELARRITCKICVSDVERLRCPQCLKGICRGCHSRVENCPHCRNEKKHFQPVIMTRL